MTYIIRKHNSFWTVESRGIRKNRLSPYRMLFMIIVHIISV